ncbi:MAG: hypothetical protein ACFCVC_18535 [Acidimicrobiia bacterium]
MNTLPATTGRRDPATMEHLERRLARVTDSCAAVGAPVRTIGVGSFTRHPFVFDQGGSNWVVLPVSADPVVRSGRMAIPARHRRHLQRIRHIGFAELLIAHETPAGWAAEVTETPRTLTAAELERFGQATVPTPLGTSVLSETMGRVSAQLGRALGVAAAGAAAVVASFGAAAALLDPVLIGVVASDGTIAEGEPAGFVVIAQWDW